MRAVVVDGPTADDWKEIDTDGSLESLQALVHGLIEALPIDHRKATVWVNEEGKLNSLPVTALWIDRAGRVIDAIAGPFVIMGPVDGKGETRALTDKALAYVKGTVLPAESYVLRAAAVRLERVKP